MRIYEINQLLEDVNKTLNYASAQVMRPGILTEVRNVFRRIGVEKICDYKENEPGEVKRGRYRIPEEVMEIADVYDYIHVPQFPHLMDNNGYKITDGIHPGKRLQYKEQPLELIFNNNLNGTIYLSYYSLYRDDDGELIIPEVAYKACLEQATYKMITASNNRQNPRWQERLIIQRDADREISFARSELNKTTAPVHRTTRLLN